MSYRKVELKDVQKELQGQIFNINENLSCK